jgi:hypothetical protein
MLSASTRAEVRRDRFSTMLKMISVTGSLIPIMRLSTMPPTLLLPNILQNLKHV